MKRISLALGSGGARGIAHIAFLEAIDRLGVQVGEIAGTSIGALVGAFYAAGIPAAKIREIACSFALSDLPGIIDLGGIHDSGLIKGEHVEKWISERLPVRKFEELKIPLRIIATDFWAREEVVFDSGELMPAIRASISIPGIFRPLTWQARTLVDGGVVNPVPFDRIRGRGAIVAIDVSGLPGPAGSKIPGRLEVLVHAFETMQKIIAEERARDRRIALYLRPSLRGFSILDFLRNAEILETVKKDVEFFEAWLVRKRFAPKRK